MKWFDRKDFLSQIWKYLDRRSRWVSYLRRIKNLVSGAEMNKLAYLVLGPESHGSHLVTDVLINAGCIGHAGNHVPWQPGNKVLLRGVKKPWEYQFPTDLQPWDRKPPTNESPIVWRRSLPHGKQWIDISQMIRDLKSRGYKVSAIVISRDTHSGLQSQLKWRHVKDLKTGQSNISKAYLHIFHHLQKMQVPFTFVNYESLALYPKAQDFLLEQLGLPLPKRRWPIYDGNRKWHDDILNNAASDFPEGWYPCVSGDREAYFDRLENGYQKMKEQSVVICGLARDAMNALPNVMAKIERLGQTFKDYKVVIVENDSIDGTSEMLQYWKKINPKVDVLSQQLNARSWDDVKDVARTEAMASYRNQYLDHIRESQDEFDYMIVVDLDIRLGFSYDGIANTFGYEDWDVVSSNGILVPPYGDPISNPMFFDSFAFRQKAGEQLDVESINKLQFNRGEDLVPVESAFGGLAIYTRESVMAGGKYGGQDCEHVVFHKWLHQNGFERQFLNPSQLVLYSGS